MPEVKERKLPRMPNVTTMYSINKDTRVVVVHRLPFKRDDAQIEDYVKKGLTFERPMEKVAEVAHRVLAERHEEETQTLDRLLCDSPGCAFLAKTDWGLTVHKRKHNRGKK